MQLSNTFLYVQAELPEADLVTVVLQAIKARRRWGEKKSQPGYVKNSQKPGYGRMKNSSKCINTSLKFSVTNIYAQTMQYAFQLIEDAEEIIAHWKTKL